MSTPIQQALRRAANHFDTERARLGGELYPDDLRAYAASLDTSSEGLAYDPPAQKPVHPRGRLREALRREFWGTFGALGRAVPRRASEEVYKWHLAESRVLSTVRIAQELNEIADALSEAELEEAEALVRARADAIEDSVDAMLKELR